MPALVPSCWLGLNHSCSSSKQLALVTVVSPAAELHCTHEHLTNGKSAFILLFKERGESGSREMRDHKEVKVVDVNIGSGTGNLTTLLEAGT